MKPNEPSDSPIPALRQRRRSASAIRPSSASSPTSRSSSCPGGRSSSPSTSSSDSLPKDAVRRAAPAPVTPERTPSTPAARACRAHARRARCRDEPRPDRARPQREPDADGPRWGAVVALHRAGRSRPTESACDCSNQHPRLLTSIARSSRCRVASVSTKRAIAPRVGRTGASTRGCTGSCPPLGDEVCVRRREQRHPGRKVDDVAFDPGPRRHRGVRVGCLQLERAPDPGVEAPVAEEAQVVRLAQEDVEEGAGRFARRRTRPADPRDPHDPHRFSARESSRARRQAVVTSSATPVNKQVSALTSN